MVGMDEGLPIFGIWIWICVVEVQILSTNLHHLQCKFAPSSVQNQGICLKGQRVIHHLRVASQAFLPFPDIGDYTSNRKGSLSGSKIANFSCQAPNYCITPPNKITDTEAMTSREAGDNSPRQRIIWDHHVLRAQAASCPQRTQR